jgi:hypothetical protein
MEPAIVDVSISGVWGPHGDKVLEHEIHEALSEAGLTLVPGSGPLHQIGGTTWHVILDASWPEFVKGIGMATTAGAAVGLRSLCRKIFRAEEKSEPREGSVTINDLSTNMRVRISTGDLDRPDAEWQKLVDVLSLNDLPGKSGWVGHSYEPDGGWARPGGWVRPN